jgi:thiamine transporter ThiT
MSAGAIVGMVIGGLVAFLWHFGAASLSYAKYGSIGWAILDFFFASLYYPFYALVLNTPTSTMGAPMMGGRSMRWLKKLF